MLKPLLGLAGFCVRHLVALFVTVATACLLWTVVYFALLLWAVFSGGGIGGPLAFPAGLLFVLVAATLAVLSLFLPATALAELVARRRGFPILVQIPISVAFLAVLSFIVVGTVMTVRSGTTTPKDFLIASGLLFVIHLLPLGLYWWVAQSGPLIVSIVRRFSPSNRS